MIAPNHRLVAPPASRIGAAPTILLLINRDVEEYCCLLRLTA